MNETMLDLLYRSFDGPLDEEEDRRLGEALAGSDELRAEKARIAAMRAALADGAAGSFRPMFAQRVMHRITAAGAERNGDLLFEALLRLFRPLAVVGAAAAILAIALNLRESGEISLAAAFAPTEPAIEVLLETPLDAMLEEMP
jgi:anti-sigma factor RsiW